jgi:hypothetical protein
MVQQVRNQASVRGLKVSVVDAGDSITVIVLGEKEVAGATPQGPSQGVTGMAEEAHLAIYLTVEDLADELTPEQMKWPRDQQAKYILRRILGSMLRSRWFDYANWWPRFQMTFDGGTAGQQRVLIQYGEACDMIEKALPPRRPEDPPPLPKPTKTPPRSIDAPWNE